MGQWNRFTAMSVGLNLADWWHCLALKESGGEQPGPAPLHSIIDLPLLLRIPHRTEWSVTFPVTHDRCLAIRHARKAIYFILPASTLHR